MTLSAIILSLTLLVPAAGEKPGVHVLCYHAFLERDNPFCFTIEELRDQMDYFIDRGFTFVTYGDIINNRVTGTRNILVTVDDGNRTVYDAYYRVFKPRGIQPVLGIYPAITGKKEYALTWEQLRKLSDEGCVIAAHGYYHRKINAKLYHREKRAFYNEIYLSKRILENRLGRTVNLFIYPYGVRSPVTLRYLKEAGYRHAFTIDSGGIGLPMDGHNTLELPRYMVTRGNRKWVVSRIMKNTMHQGTAVAAKKPGPEMKTALRDTNRKKKPEKKASVSDRRPSRTVTSAKRESPKRKSPFLEVSSFKDKGYLNLKPKTYRRYVERIGHVMKTVRRDVMSMEMVKAGTALTSAETVKGEKDPGEEGFFSCDFSETVEKSAEGSGAGAPELRGSLENPGKRLKQGADKVREVYADMSRSSYDSYAGFFALFRSRIDDMRNRLISLLKSRGE